MTKEFILKTPDAEATFRQGIMIRRLTGEDIRQRVPPLTMQQASDIIAKALAEGAEKKPFAPATDTPERVPYKKMMNEATKAANEAGKDWLAKAKPTYVVTSAKTGKDLGYPPMLDVCGFAHIEITDRRTAFARWIAKHQNDENRWVIVPHHYRSRQELGLKEAVEGAALAVLIKHGVKGIRLWSRID